MLAVLALALLFSLPAGAARAGDFEKLRACMAENVPKKSASMSFRLVSLLQGGSETTLRGHVFWKPGSEGESRTFVCLSAPQDVRGLAYLVHEHAKGQTVWGYLPEKERVFRLTSKEAARRGRLGRTAISYEDLRYLPLNLAGAEAPVVTEAPDDAGPIERVALVLAPGPDARYARIEASVDRSSCVVLEADLYAAGGKLVKVMRADPDTVTETGVRYARAITVKDQLEGIETRMLVEELSVDGDLSERMFTSGYLGRGRCP